jgi:transposase
LGRPGEYWKPIEKLLEGDVPVFWVTAAQVKHVPGRKTDRAEARWLAKLMRYGWLQASFIPPVEQRELRDLTRYRTQLVPERTRQVNRVQGVLEGANMKLASVASEIMGVSGRAILRALIAGQADPAAMAELANGRLRSKLPLLEQALTGLVRHHHRQLRALQLAPIDFLVEQLDTLSAESTHLLTDLSAVPPPPPAATTGDAAQGGHASEPGPP